VTKSDNLNVILIYRPPSSGQDNLTELCEILRGADNNTILIGDFNMPGIDWENTQARDVRGRELLETATEKGLQQLVNFPTHTKGTVTHWIYF
jgi:endonuclease/exonuclease/phosphatase (EEP) superfamily protein YafD